MIHGAICIVIVDYHVVLSYMLHGIDTSVVGNNGIIISCINMYETIRFYTPLYWTMGTLRGGGELVFKDFDLQNRSKTINNNNRTSFSISGT